MPALTLYAGPAALDWIRNHGLRPEHVKAMVGASGGPKWFVLYGLDRYLASTFFAARPEPLQMLGSSAGAWRMACMAQLDPCAAIERLAYHYSRQRYSARPTPAEVSNEARKLLDLVLQEDGAAEIVNNPVYRLHMVADRARTLVRSDNRHLLSIGLLLCGLSNVASRRSLRWYFERVIFHNAVGGGSAFQPHDMPTRYVPLEEENLRDALMATGSIPIVMSGVRDIKAAPAGTYRDGGITDYHFDIPFHRGDGLVLYPHFYASFTAGWFDRLAAWRGVNPMHFDNVVLLAPSPDFVASLPYRKIPDRRDFEKLDYDSRFSYWQYTLDESARLADEFDRILTNEAVLDHVRPLFAQAENSRRGWK